MAHLLQVPVNSLFCRIVAVRFRQTKMAAWAFRVRSLKPVYGLLPEVVTPKRLT